ncbi:MAG: helix-turn-helix domain-containing protein, partial [Petrotogales bacterium]
MKYKTFKFRLMPNSSQKELINKTIGCTRLIYNCMLYGRRKTATPRGERSEG